MGTKLGFVGLGHMGLPMVSRLADTSSTTILAYDIANAPFQKLSEHSEWGRRLMRADALADLEDCGTVITMLPNSIITNRVVEGTQEEPGLSTILKPGSIVIDMGSSDPKETPRLARGLASRDIEMFDAPVSGAVAKAEAGTLTIMVGCNEDDLDRLRPVLSKMGSKLIATGKLGSAHAMKTLNNYVYAEGLLATCEVVKIAAEMDLDLSVFASVLNDSSGRNVATETKLTQFILNGTYAGGFPLALQAKDLRTAAALQDSSGVSAPQLAACSEFWTRAVQALPPEADNTEIFKFLSHENSTAELQEAK